MPSLQRGNQICFSQPPPDLGDHCTCPLIIRHHPANEAESNRAQSHWLPGIPGHTLLRLIGQGSYGQIWLARNQLGTLRAVKLVHRRTFAEARPYQREYEGVQRYEPISREHEGLVDVLQVGRDDAAGFFYCVMELADAVQDGEAVDTYTPRTLAQLITRRGQLPMEEVIRVGVALCQALDFLHARCLAHRDIKPGNIIFVAGRPKLADVGLVGDLGGALTYVGTEGYIPPEGPGSVQADLYALGKVLYEAATGHERQRFPELPTLPDNLREEHQLLELNQVLLVACEADPKKRFPNAQQMCKALVLLQSGKSFRQSRQRRRNQLRAAITLSALAACLAAWWWGLPPEYHYQEPLKALQLYCDRTLHPSKHWVLCGPMAHNRQLHTATRLPDGRVLVLGGYTKSRVLSEGEFFDPTTRKWSSAQTLITARFHHAAALLPEGNVLVVGGATDIDDLYWPDRAEIQDPRRGRSSVANTNYPRSGLTATLLTNGMVLVAGGGLDITNNARGLRKAELYDPKSNQFMPTGDMVEARYQHTATLLHDGRVLLAGGTRNYYDNNGTMASAELYDPATGQWTSAGMMRDARCLHEAVLLPSGKVLIVGGTSGGYKYGVALATTELYDPIVGRWSSAKSMQFARSLATATLLTNGKVLVAGGGGNDGDFLSNTEVYDAVTDTWSFAEHMNHIRAAHTATLLPDGSVLMVGGWNGTTVSSTELYVPLPDSQGPGK